MNPLVKDWQDRTDRFRADAERILSSAWPATNDQIKPVASPKIYDVVFSFAGEDRIYVEEAANYVRNSGIEVFYDFFEQIELWGKNLAEHLDEIYSERGRFCVMFISKAYAEKMWTRHERRSAFDRAMREDDEYILPARFDDTPIQGLHSSIGYINLRHLEAKDFAALLIAKVKSKDIPKH